MSKTILGLWFLLLVVVNVSASDKRIGSFETDLVPDPVEYALIAPQGFAASSDLPLVLYLHGGGGSRDALDRVRPIFESLWNEGAIPPAIVATASVGARSFYMNYHDGSERWEDVVSVAFLEHLRATYPATRDSRRTFITGISMGGMGSLRIAFRHPDRFAAVAALEPGIEPILAFGDMRPKHRFWRGDRLMQRAYGNPVDADYWADNNPASMAVSRRDAIRESGLQIYLEAGDEDQFWLYEGAEFLHQTLWRERVRHEYHLVRGADHVGPSVLDRHEEAFRFLFRTLDPWPMTERMRQVDDMLDPLKARAGGVDHYNEK